MKTDQELIEQARGGDRGAFDEIVHRYQDALYRHLLRLGGNPDEAQDVCQEAFVAFYLQLRRFRAGRPVAPLLFTIARRLWLKRRAAAERERPLLDEPADHQEVAAAALAVVERAEIARAVAALPLEQREALSLYYDQGLTQREIAEVVRAPLGTVASRLHRAVAALRAALAPVGMPTVVAGGLGPGGDDAWGSALHELLAGQASAPSSLAPAVAAGVGGLTPAGVGLLFTVHSLWTGVPIMVKAGIAGVLALGLAGGVVHYAYGGSTAPAAKPAAAAKPVHVVMKYLGGGGGPAGRQVEVWGNGRRLVTAGRQPDGTLRETVTVDLDKQEFTVYTATKQATYTARTTDAPRAVEAMVGLAPGFLHWPLPRGEQGLTRERRTEGGRQVEVVTDQGKSGDHTARLVARLDAKTGELLGMDFYTREQDKPEQHLQSWVITPGATLPPSLAKLSLPAGTRQERGTLAERPQAGAGTRLVMLDRQGVEVWTGGGTLRLQ